MWVLVNVALDLHSTSNMVPVCMLVIATTVVMLHLLLADLVTHCCACMHLVNRCSENVCEVTSNLIRQESARYMVEDDN